MRAADSCDARAETTEVNVSATTTAATIAHVSTLTGAKYVISSGMSAPATKAAQVVTPDRTGTAAGMGLSNPYSHSS